MLKAPSSNSGAISTSEKSSLISSAVSALITVFETKTPPNALTGSPASAAI